MRKRWTETALLMWMLCGLGCASAQAVDAADVAPLPNPGKTVATEARRLLEEGRYPEAEALSRQILGVVEEAHGPASIAYAEVLDVLVAALIEEGKSSESATSALAERALAIKEKELGRERPAVVASLNNLAQILQAIGSYTEAKALFERSVAILDEGLGPGHPELTAKILNNLASLLRAMGSYADAKPLCERSLAIRERQFGPEHPDVAESLNSLGGLLQAMGSYAEAKPLFERALTIREKKLGPEHPDVAESLNDLASLLHAMGFIREAKPLYERALTIRENRLGPEHPEVATSLGNTGSLLHAMGSYTEAKALHERALGIREKKLGPEHPQVAVSLESLGLLLRAQGSYTEAEPLLERALAIREKRLGPEHPLVATSLESLGLLLRDMGSSSEAKSLYDRSLAIREKRLGPEHPQVATSLSCLALVLTDLGFYAEAKPLHERALAIREKRLGPEHLDVAESLNDLAGLLQDMGSYAEAKPLYERTLAILEKQLSPEHPDVAGTLNNLASLLHAMGFYAEAKPRYERSLAILEKQFGPEHPNVAGSLNNLASLLRDMGSYAEAKPLYERALAIAEKQFGPEHPHVATGLNNLARLLQAMGRYAEAKALYERALAIREKQLGPEHYEVARNLNNLAGLFQDMGAFAEAKTRYERALAILEKQLGPEHPHVATTLDSLGLLLRDMGSYAEAKAHYERALAIREGQLGPEHPFVAASLNNLAALQVLIGENGEGLQRALRAEEIGRSHLLLTVRTLAEAQALRYASVRTSALDLLLAVAAESSASIKEAPRSAWETLVRSRAVVLDEMASRHRDIAGSSDPEIAQLFERYVLTSQRVANLYVRGPGQEGPERYRLMLQEARRDRERAEERLAERSVGMRQELARQSIGLEEVTMKLPSKSALVAYALYRTRPMPDRKVQTHYLAFVLRQGDKEPFVVPLGKARAIDESVADWKRLVEQPAEYEAYRVAGETLRRSVWDPIVHQLGDAKQVFIVPDGALNLVSFAALPTGKTRYLVESGPVFHYLSSERDLVPLEKTAPGDKGLLAIGGAAFDEPSLFAVLAALKRNARTAESGTAALASPGTHPPAGVVAQNSPTYRSPPSGCEDFRSVRFEPLPASPLEAREISDLWRKHGGSAGEVLIGASATEAVFKRQAGGHRILHLATHGFFLDCPSALDGSKRTVEPVEAQENQPLPAKGENPLVLSGLVLAGANHRGDARPDEEDGILTAEEIAALDLSSVEWAVLSACDTGRGEVRAGEGVFGLRRAFQVAGARTLIMSLWRVDDQAARRWMRALYTGRLEKKLSTADAARDASLQMLKQQRLKHESTHPFSWAAFVAAGDWH